MLDPAHAGTLFEPLDRGLERAGRSRGEIDIAACTAMAGEDDLDAARDAVRPWLAFYLGAMGSREKNFSVELAERTGHGAAARECQGAVLGGDRGRAAPALGPGLIDAMALATTPDALAGRLAAFEAVGVDTLLVVPCGSDRPRVVRALAEAV